MWTVSCVQSAVHRSRSHRIRRSAGFIGTRAPVQAGVGMVQLDGLVAVGGIRTPGPRASKAVHTEEDTVSSARSEDKTPSQRACDLASAGGARTK